MRLVHSQFPRDVAERRGAHGFFLKPLKIDEIIQPGKTTEVNLTPQTAGTYLLICDHFCGVNHAAMNMKVIVE